MPPPSQPSVLASTGVVGAMSRDGAGAEVTVRPDDNVTTTSASAGTSTSCEEDVARLLPLLLLGGDLDAESVAAQRDNVTGGGSERLLEAAAYFELDRPLLAAPETRALDGDATAMSDVKASPATPTFLSRGLGRYAFARWDATALPLRANVADIIVSDLPFGRRCGNHGVNERLYPKLLREWHRVLRKSAAPGEPSGTMVLLTLERPLLLQTLHRLGCIMPDVEFEGRTSEDAAAAGPPMWRLMRPPWQLYMGGLLPYAFIIRKL
jgi:hypothetical protein